MWGTSTHRQGCGGLSIPCRLSIPRIRIPAGSGSAGPALARSKQPAMVEPSSSPSIILIGRRWQPGGPWQRGCTGGRPEPSPRAGREHRSDKGSQTTTTTPLLGTSKRHLRGHRARVGAGWGHGQEQAGRNGDAGEEQSSVPCAAVGTRAESSSTAVGSLCLQTFPQECAPRDLPARMWDNCCSQVKVSQV